MPHPAWCNARATREVPSSKLKEQPPHRKIGVTSNLPVGRISVVTLIRTDTTLDHSQKAEKVWRRQPQTRGILQSLSKGSAPGKARKRKAIWDYFKQLMHPLGNTPRKNWGIHIAAFLSRQPLVKGERLVRYEVNAVMQMWGAGRVGCIPANVLVVLCTSMQKATGIK